MTPGSSLVLFDIDGTLVDVRGAGRKAFSVALREAFGVDDDLAAVRFAGATDRGVLRDLSRRHGRSFDDDAAFFIAMEKALRSALVAAPPRVLPGVRACLAQLHATAHVTLGLVTGNARATASAKLETAALDPAAFVVGGFGDEHDDRSELARLALERAERIHGRRFARVILAGDTPADIAAAHAVGACAVAVTTGPFDRAALAAAGADVVLDELSAPALVFGDLLWPTT
jgi:phosphoglycolate phosphatase